MKFSKNLGTILLAIFLILYGLMGLGLSFPYMDIIMAVLALAAGILKLLGR